MATGFFRSALSAGISTSSGGVLNIGGIYLSSSGKIKNKELEKKLIHFANIIMTFNNIYSI
jgi:hypothetical protein